jgi:hypothetical protein
VATTAAADVEWAVVSWVNGLAEEADSGGGIACWPSRLSFEAFANRPPRRNLDLPGWSGKVIADPVLTLERR